MEEPLSVQLCCLSPIHLSLRSLHITGLRSHHFFVHYGGNIAALPRLQPAKRHYEDPQILAAFRHNPICSLSLIVIDHPLSQQSYLRRLSPSVAVLSFAPLLPRLRGKGIAPELLILRTLHLLTLLYRANRGSLPDLNSLSTQHLLINRNPNQLTTQDLDNPHTSPLIASCLLERHHHRHSLIDSLPHLHLCQPCQERLQHLNLPLPDLSRVNRELVNLQPPLTRLTHLIRRLPSHPQEIPAALIHFPILLIRSILQLPPFNLATYILLATLKLLTQSIRQLIQALRQRPIHFITTNLIILYILRTLSCTEPAQAYLRQASQHYDGNLLTHRPEQERLNPPLPPPHIAPGHSTLQDELLHLRHILGEISYISLKWLSQDLKTKRNQPTQPTSPAGSENRTNHHQLSISKLLTSESLASTLASSKPTPKTHHHTQHALDHCEGTSAARKARTFTKPKTKSSAQGQAAIYAGLGRDSVSENIWSRTRRSIVVSHNIDTTADGQSFDLAPNGALW